MLAVTGTRGVTRVRLPAHPAGRVGDTKETLHRFPRIVGKLRPANGRVEQPAHVDPVTREVYSHEVISAGFWFGDDQVPEPAFSSDTAPEPAGLVEEPLRPAAARWIDSRGAHLALSPYEDVRTAADPRGVVLDFLESAYAAGARRAG
jgi:hypothetical protein